MRNPVLVLPQALQALFALDAATNAGELPKTVRDLAKLRVSQINGCSVCVENAFKPKNGAVPDTRLYAVTAWRTMSCFSDAERAALALAEAVTRQADAAEGVTDEIWNAARKHFDEKALSALLLQIAMENVWNRLNCAVRQPADAPWE